MNLTDKAEELTNSFYSQRDSEGVVFCVNWSSAKQCALITVDYLIKHGNFDYWDADKIVELEKLKSEIINL